MIASARPALWRGLRKGCGAAGAGGGAPSGAAGGDLTGTYPNPTVDANKITYAKMQQVSATDKVLGRSTAGAGNVEEIACTAAGRALLDDANAAAQRTTLGLGSAALAATGDFDPAGAAAAAVVTAEAYADAGLATKQDHDADLDTWASLTPSANAQSLVTAATYAAMRALLDLEAGTDFLSPAAIAAAYQPLDSELTALAGLTSAADKMPYFTGSGAAALTDLTSAARSLLDDTSTAVMRSTLGVREKLSAARTYYVRTDGNDSNDGLTNSSGGAFLTIQKAVGVASAIDNGGYDITIQIGNGTYTGAVILSSFIGAGKIILLGDETTPSNVIISTTSTHAVTYGFTTNAGGVYALRGVRIKTTTSGFGIVLSNHAVLEIQNVDFGACVSAHMLVSGGAFIRAVGNWSISGGASGHILVAGIGKFIYQDAPTLTVSASVTITTFAQALHGGLIDCRGVTITLGGGVSVTGTRYSATLNGVILSNGGSGTYFPGNAAGSTATGGQYA